ncbi:MAG: hypothetical protein HC888_17895 [Candidatus Competibacteraceae bacterium]|nr:hypothetical protein [Candidatus Competibacteraceae bacterium]
MTATPEPGWRFDHWEGDATGSAPQLDVVMDGDKSITAVFVENLDPTLSVLVQGNGVVNPAAGEHVYALDAIVYLFVTPDPGWAFDHWEGDLSGTNDTGQFLVMDADKSVTAIFSPQAHTLTIGVAGQGATSPPVGSHPTLDGREIQITAANPLEGGWVFHHWEGDATGGENPIDVLMDSNKSVTAVFVEAFSLSTNGRRRRQPQSPGRRPLDRDRRGRHTQCIAPAGLALRSLGRGLDGRRESRHLRDGRRKSISAVFVEVQTVTLSVSTTGIGAVEPTGTTQQELDSFVLLTATPQEGWQFVAWEGDVSSDANPFTLLMDSNKAITAVFEVRPQYTLLTAVIGDGSVIPEGSIDYYEDTQVILTATPEEGATFIEWQGDLTGTENPASVLMDSNKTITAVFTSLSAEGEGEGEGEGEPFIPHSADITLDGRISLSELLRVIQFYNLAGYHCATPPSSTEDGFRPLTRLDAQSCTPHASDYNAQDWVIGFAELLRLIQFYNSAGYVACPEAVPPSEDGFCVVID